MGYCGSGKSTLCRELAERYHLPSLHLDTVQFLPGWQVRNAEEKQDLVRTFLEEHADGWVIDGNYSKLYFDERAEAADLIVLMLFNRVNCFFRCLKRYSLYRGKTRPDMTGGCPEKFDAEFMRWILWEGRGKATRERFRAVSSRYPGKVTVLKNQRQLDRFLVASKGEQP